MMYPMSINHYSGARPDVIVGHFEHMNSTDRPSLFLIAGPYRSNTGDDSAKIAENMRRMNEAGLAVFRLGHIPVTGEALALPLIEVAGSEATGDPIFNEI